MFVGVKQVVRASVLALVVALSIMQLALADTTGGIGGRPANPDPSNPRTQSIFIMTLDRGQSKQDAVKVVNNTATTQTIHLYAVDGVVTNTGAYTCRQDAEARVDIGAWTQLAQSEVTLESGKDATVPFTVTMPANADVGEHDGCIVFESADNTITSSGGNVQIHTRQAIRLVATVPGNLKRAVSIQDFSTSMQGGNVMYHLVVKNVGNVSADIDTKVTVKSLFGTTLFSNGGGYPVIANQQLALDFQQTNHPFFGGWYKAQATIQYDKRPGQFGTTDKHNLLTIASAPKTIFIVPTLAGILIMIAFVLLIVGGASYLYLRRRERLATLQNGHRHTVKKGETVQSIASNYGTSWKKLTSINSIKPPYAIEAGTVLRVPKKQTRAKKAV